MKTACFVFGVSLWALLIVDVCCGPVKREFSAGGSYGGSSMYPSTGSYQGLPYSMDSSGLVAESTSPEKPKAELAAPAGSVYLPKPDQSRGSAPTPVGVYDYGGPGQPGAGFQSGDEEIKWLMAPPVFGAEVASSPAMYARSPFPPAYKAGELSNYEKSSESGNYHSESKSQGSLLPPLPNSQTAYMMPLPLDQSVAGYTSQPQPGSGPAGYWWLPPYYDYMFLTGQYPSGTFSRFSSSAELGRDNIKEAHYVREYLPYRTPSHPMNAPAKHGGGGAAAVRYGSSSGAAMKPNFQAEGYGRSYTIKH